MALSRGRISSGPITSDQIRFVLRGLRFDRDLVVGWQITPSLGLVARDVDRLGIDIRSFKEPLTRSVKRVIIPSIRKNFDAGGRPGWEPLSEYAIKRRGYSAWPILIRSGALRKGATQFNIWDIGQTSATVRKLPDKVWYGALHQSGFGGFGQYVEAAKKALGGRAPAREVTRRAFELMESKHGAGGRAAAAIPQRRFIMYQEEDIDRIQQIFYEWLVERTIAVGRFAG